MTAAALASEGAQLTLLHVVDIARNFFSLGAFVEIAEEDIQAYDKRIVGAMGDAMSIISEYGATASMLIVRGRPIRTAIKQIAKSLDVDVILMGTHGRRGLSRVLWGSTTEDVIREADVPVIAIRESSATMFRLDQLRRTVGRRLDLPE